MKKDKVNININVSDEGDVKVSVVPEEVKSRIPRPGDSIYIVSPYPQIDPEDVDGEEILEEDVKTKQIMGYSYNPVMVKASILNDELDEVTVNGDYKIPLYKNAGDPEKKIMVFTSEEKAQDKFKTLTNVSLIEAARRIELYKHIQSNLAESLEKLYH